jgi:Flp pilus assembly protein CpaB
MRRQRGLVFILIGVVLAFFSGYMVLAFARQSAVNAAASVTMPTPVPKVYVVVAQKDLAENVAISAQDVAKQEIEADFAPPGAIAAPEITVGKYTTARVYKGEILVAPLLADTKASGALASEVPEGKVAMAVTVNDALNSLGALRAGDHVDILLSLELKAIQVNPNGNGSTTRENPTGLSTQVTMQNVPILAIGPPAGDQAPSSSQNGQSSAAPAPAPQVSAAQARTITFLLDHQGAVTLKFIKDSGGIMDLVVRSPEDTELAKTDAVTLDTIYKKYSFRFVQPVSP